MLRVFPLLFCLLTQFTFAQTVLEWSPDIKLTFSDFKSPATEIGSPVGSLSPGVAIEFGYQMSAAQFMMTKNFNSKVLCRFDPYSAAIVAPDEITAEQLIGFAQFSFDLGELYSRKLRKKLYEAKGVFSGNDFFQQYYSEIHQRFTSEITESGKLTNFGIESSKLQELHNRVKEELNNYNDFCKTCKPPKKSARRNS